MNRTRTRTRHGNAGVRPRSHGFIVINTRTGEILSELLKKRDAARDLIAAIVAKHGRTIPAPGDVQYRDGRWFLSLGVHQVMLYPGEMYTRESYRP